MTTFYRHCRLLRLWIRGVFVPTVSSDAAARRSGRKPTSSICIRKFWSSMPYTRSRKSTIGALWSGQKQADISGSVTEPSDE